MRARSSTDHGRWTGDPSGVSRYLRIGIGHTSRYLFIILVNSAMFILVYSLLYCYVLVHTSSY